MKIFENRETPAVGAAGASSETAFQTCLVVSDSTDFATAEYAYRWVERRFRLPPSLSKLVAQQAGIGGTK